MAQQVKSLAIKLEKGNSNPEWEERTDSSRLVFDLSVCTVAPAYPVTIHKNVYMV